ncbi:MAG: lysylphosphatidylglycerol synthase transmembrane domain-containing protein [Gemmatimonadaceae bacterium]
MKLGWRGALGLLLSALLLAWTLRGVKLGEVWHVLAGANLALLLLSAAAATVIFPLRARRWRVILDPVAPDLPFGMLWRSTAIGMMVNNVVPARAGEIARAYALTRETPRVPFSAAFASLAVDRVFDAVAVLGLMFLAMLDPAFPRGSETGRLVGSWAGTGAVAVLGLLGALYLLVFFPAPIISLYEAFARRVAPRLESRGRDALIAFASGLGVLRSPRRFAAVLWWTVLHWLTNALAFWIGFRAVGIAAPFGAALFLQGLIAIGVAIPSSPGFFGVFEAFARTGLSVYGVDKTLATSWAIGFHLLSFIPITVIGAIYFARLGLHFGDLTRTTAADDAGGADENGAPPPVGETAGGETAGGGRRSRGVA